MTKLLTLALVIALDCQAQESNIEDNSFLIEEAFNQESGIYQFINHYQYDKRAQAWEYAFEGEIPITHQVHQFSFQIPVEDNNSQDKQTSVGDLIVNYRWQPLNRDGLMIADRLGLILPTGDFKNGHGHGVVGMDFKMAATLPMGEIFMNHWNFGLTYYPKAKHDHPHRHDLLNLSAGTSVIWKGNGYYNLMLELVTEREQTLNQNRQITTESTLTINPGIRFAINLQDCQVVPGIGFPYELINSPHEYGFLLYLSFEPKL